MKLVLIVVALSILSVVQAKQWAVLVAGSDTYDNYRHQADVCHAYQVLRAHGIPASQIVVMMQDDIAYNSANPYKGNIINQPNGKNVYQNVPKDYIGNQVTPQNFLKVLAGDAGLRAQGKKVIQATSADTVFVYYADHGAQGLVAFPNGYLTAADLNTALLSNYKAGKFGKLVFYLEACESGSMFENILPSNVPIFATTAANAKESSYAAYYDKTRKAWLGDLYSINWMEDSDKRPNLMSYSLQAQFEEVRKLTTNSHVLQFGNTGMGSDPVGAYQGSATASNSISSYSSARSPVETCSARDVPLVTAKRGLEIAAYAGLDMAQSQKTVSEIQAGREFMDQSIRTMAQDLSEKLDLDIDSLVGEKRSLTKHTCAGELHKAFNDHCFDIAQHTYSMAHLWILNNICEQIDDDETQCVAGAIKDHCENRQTPMTVFDRII